MKTITIFHLKIIVYYCREILLYIAWACLRNVVLKKTICITANGEILDKLVYQTSPIVFKANEETLYSIYNNSDSTVNRQLQWACIYLSVYLSIYLSIYLSFRKK